MANKIRRYTSADIDVTYDVKRCIHAAECVRGLPAVFDTKKRPWVQPDKANADTVAEVILRCPSGALHYERKDGGAAESIAVGAKTLWAQLDVVSLDDKPEQKALDAGLKVVSNKCIRIEHERLFSAKL